MKNLQTLSRKMLFSALAISIALPVVYGAVYGINKLGKHFFNDESVLCVQRRKGRIGQVEALAMTADGKTLVTGGAYIRVWDVATGEKQFDNTPLGGVVIPAEFFITDLTITPDQKSLVVAMRSIDLVRNDYKIEIWDLASRQAVQTLTEGHVAHIHTLLASADGQTLVSEDDEGGVLVWDLATGEVKTTISTQPYKRFPVVISPDGTMLASMDEEGTVTFWDVGAAEAIGSLKADPSHTPLAISADNQTLLIQNAGSVKRFRNIETQTKQQAEQQANQQANQQAEQQMVEGSYLEYPFAVTPNGKQVLIQTERGIDLYDFLTGELVKTFKSGETYVGIDVSPDGESVLTIDSRGNHTLLDFETGEMVHLLEGRAGRGPYAFTPDAKILVNGNKEGDNITMWDLETGTRIRRFCNQ